MAVTKVNQALYSMCMPALPVPCWDVRHTRTDASAKQFAAVSRVYPPRIRRRCCLLNPCFSFHVYFNSIPMLRCNAGGTQDGGRRAVAKEEEEGEAEKRGSGRADPGTLAAPAIRDSGQRYREEVRGWPINHTAEHREPPTP